MSQDSAPAVIYLPIPGFPGYRVGNDGSIWSCWERPAVGDKFIMTTRWRELKPNPAARYPSVALYREGKSYTRLVHRLVLEAFIGPCPEGMEACHDPDRNPRNCRADNLRWGTHAENVADKVKHGTAQVGERHGMSKLTDEKVRNIRKRLAAGESRKAIAEDLGVHKTLIGLVDRGRIWRHVV